MTRENVDRVKKYVAPSYPHLGKHMNILENMKKNRNGIWKYTQIDITTYENTCRYVNIYENTRKYMTYIDLYIYMFWVPRLVF